MHAPASLVIASRRSRLAMWQAEHVRSRLQALHPDCKVEILGLSTRGDDILDKSLSKLGGKGLFVKELETALRNGRAQLAVHSFKDVPMSLPAGFEIAAVLERGSPQDAFVSNTHEGLDALPAGAVVGTSSLRRQAAILARFPWLVVRPLRGNLDSRLQKLDNGEYDAIVLAAAGLQRLGLQGRIKALLAPDAHVPAPGQGALAIEVARDAFGANLRSTLAPLHHAATGHAVAAERCVSRFFGGSCEVPLGAHATVDGAVLRLRAMVATPDGRERAEAECAGPPAQAEQIGRRAAELLELNGARRILAHVLT